MGHKFFSFHRFIIQEKEVKVYLLCGSLTDYATLAAIAGVPHELVSVELGGIYVTKVVGAVPEIVVDGLAVAVPPVMLAVVPAPDDPSLTQVVTKVNTVLEVAVAVVRMYSPEYGAVALFNWNMVAGDAVRLYQPVVVARVVCVPPEPLSLVVPV
jgi:hypothetical protein